MKRALLVILAAIAAALVAWRVTRYDGPYPAPWSEADDGIDHPPG